MEVKTLNQSRRVWLPPWLWLRWRRLPRRSEREGLGPHSSKHSWCTSFPSAIGRPATTWKTNPRATWQREAGRLAIPAPSWESRRLSPPSLEWCSRETGDSEHQRPPESPDQPWTKPVRSLNRDFRTRRYRPSQTGSRCQFESAPECYTSFEYPLMEVYQWVGPIENWLFDITAVAMSDLDLLLFRKNSFLREVTSGRYLLIENASPSCSFSEFPRSFLRFCHPRTQWLNVSFPAHSESHPPSSSAAAIHIADSSPASPWSVFRYSS